MSHEFWRGNGLSWHGVWYHERLILLRTSKRHLAISLLFFAIAGYALADRRDVSAVSPDRRDSSQSSEGAQMQAPLKNLISFSNTADEPTWIAVNDSVMGGVSIGAAAISGGQLHFFGALSLENNGGFASLRTVGFRPDLTLTTAIVLRVLGDGRDYQLRVASNARFRGNAVAYSASFSTKADRWIEVEIPLAQLVPTFRGFVLDGPSLDLAKIEQIGLLIGDKREGPFSLRVDWIKTKSDVKK
jgi:NADH dehydrogenase [ubiquinone] 1 alpha subcomplex assembly factor 1